MTINYIKTISLSLQIPEKNIHAAITLLSEDATIPFIARYRKEATGSLDEVELTKIRNLYTQLKDLDNRKLAILKSLEKTGHLNALLKEQVKNSDSLTELEDIYLPYKPKRKTKASIAKAKGLEQLAIKLLQQDSSDLFKETDIYIDPKKEVHSADEALQGAGHIIAEIISEDKTARTKLRALFTNKGMVESSVVKNKEDDGKKYKNYFDWSEPVKSIPSHRMLAIRRGENENILNLSILPPYNDAISILQSGFVNGNNNASQFVEKAAIDSYKRLLSKSLETELRVSAKETADREAIAVFSDNLRQLLLESPLGSKNMMGIDPGFRTGCKLVCLDRQGKLLEYDTIFPNMGTGKDKDAEAKLKKYIKKHAIEAIAIGNGTGGRETEAFIKKINLTDNIDIVMVNENGASIYSASEAAREEFPDIDLTVRGAVSIGRRLMDPLSELVKIDPKSIGVGQYQHDVDQTLLKAELDDVVISCVNSVGVDVNIASAKLMTYVSGLGPVLAKNIVIYRDENGPFKRRNELKKVPRLGPKAFEQAAGFLRIRNGKIPLDASAVHPESYHIVDKMASDLGCTVSTLMSDKTLVENINVQNYITDKTGIPTLNDIKNELKKPGRDPRQSFKPFSFTTGVDKIDDLTEGMKLPGIVTNVTAFGAFIDIGVHQDGLVHISEMSDHFVKSPASVVKVHEKVDVRVLEIDIERKRISLSMKSEIPPPAKKKKAKPQIKSKTKKQINSFNNPFADAFNKNLKK